MEIKNQVPIAVERRSKLDLPFDHVSTGEFMKLQPMYYRHTLKTENNKFNFVSVVRPNPIQVPTFGRVRQNLRHFFIPYRLIFPNWEEYIDDVVASNFENSSQVVGVPHFTSETLWNLFTTYLMRPLTQEEITQGVVPDFKTSTQQLIFVGRGKYFYKILYSLGYDLVPPSKDFKWNALALLAYARAYVDWYANSAYLNSQSYLTLMQIFKYNDPTTALELSPNQLYTLLLYIEPAVYNTNPYFEDAWDNPVSPNDGQFTNFSFSDPTANNGAYIVTNSDGSPEMLTVRAGTPTIQIGTTYIHDALKKLTNYQKRHALAGARAIDRVLADYGIQTDYLKINRSIYVGVSTFDVEINSIFSTANGSNQFGDSVVGDYAGAGFGRGNSIMDFQNDEEGMFLTISTLQVSGGYYQGYDRNNRHLTREEFFNPNFDSLGVQSIEKGEVYVSHNFDFCQSNALAYAQHFGFTGRYGEYKRSICRVSGDISLPSRIAGGSAWHLMRQFSDIYFDDSIENVVHSEDFCRGSDGDTYNRIFTYTGSDYDPFNLFLHVDVASYAPCRSLTDSYDFESDAKRVAVNSNGSKVN